VHTLSGGHFAVFEQAELILGRFAGALTGTGWQRVDTGVALRDIR